MKTLLEPTLDTPSALIGQGTDALDTPALVADLDAASRNMQRMAEFAAKHRLRLRPHAKLHKRSDFARLQLQAGAHGLCAQTVAEAEALAAGGVNDIFITNEILSADKLRRVAAVAHQLHQRGGKLAMTVDSAEGIEQLARAMQLTNAGIDVFIEVDVGQGRCGAPTPEAAVALARALAGRGGRLHYAGLQAYHGGAQHLRSIAERRAAIASAAARLQAVCDALTVAELRPPVVSGAGTGTFAHEAASGLWTELQPGSFLFMDVDYLSNERDDAQPQFEPALFIKAQVISRSPGHAVIDAGLKSHAIESGLPHLFNLHGVAGAPMPQVTRCGDEHSTLHPGPDGAPLPALGDVVWLIPGHSDPTVNLHSHIAVVRGGLAQGRIEAIVPVQARGQW